MPEDFSGAYLDPGLYLEEITAPVLSSVGIPLTIPAFVGDSQRYRTNTEIIQLSGTTAVTLVKLGIDDETIVITDRYTGSEYAETDDYTIAQGTGEDADADTLDDTTTITRVSDGDIPSASFVTVTYRYTDPDYYKLTRFTDYDDVRDLYGDPFTTGGAINSPLTLAAFLAFVNGATEIYCVALEAADTVATTDEWTTAVTLLRDEPRINVVVPVSGSTTIHGVVKAHVDYMSNLGQYRRAIVGLGSTAAVSDIKTAAVGHSSTRMVVVGPQQMNFYEGYTNSVIVLGGEYAAAAVAGVHASKRPEEPLTRKQVRGFVGVTNAVTESTMLDYQRSGVTWLWQRRNDRIIIRHGLTTDMSNIYTRELSVQAAKDRLQTLLLDTLEAQELVGSVITETTPGIVVGAIRGALDQAMTRRLILSYSGVKYRNPDDNPTMIQIRFMYKPSLPLNYISVQFAIDTNTGTSSFVEATSPVAA